MGTARQSTSKKLKALRPWANTAHCYLGTHGRSIKQLGGNQVGCRSHNFNTAQHALQSIGFSSHDGSQGQQHRPCMHWAASPEHGEVAVHPVLVPWSQSARQAPGRRPRTPGHARTDPCRPGRGCATAAPRSRARKPGRACMGCYVSATIRPARAAGPAVWLLPHPQLSSADMQVAAGCCPCRRAWPDRIAARISVIIHLSLPPAYSLVPMQESASGSLTASMRRKKGYSCAGGLQLTQVSPYIEQAGSHNVLKSFQQSCDHFLLSSQSTHSWTVLLMRHERLSQNCASHPASAWRQVCGHENMGFPPGCWWCTVASWQAGVCLAVSCSLTAAIADRAVLARRSQAQFCDHSA